MEPVNVKTIAIWDIDETVIRIFETKTSCERWPVGFIIENIFNFCKNQYSHMFNGLQQPIFSHLNSIYWSLKQEKQKREWI